MNDPGPAVAGEVADDVVAGRRRVLAVASSGGHWVQLRRLRPAFRGQEVVYVTVRAEDAAEVDDGRCRLVPDATRWDRLRLVRLVLTMAWILVRERPDVVVSTGAAPGYVALRLGRLLGARTVWVDSMANAEELSLSGRRIGPHADLWLTQWPHLASEGGPEYRGQVL